MSPVARPRAPASPPPRLCYSQEMDREPFVTAPESRDAQGWQAPRVEVISLSCEITSYAPDDEPLF